MTDKINTTLEVKFLAATGLFEGYASVFNVVDSVQDKIAPGAFKDSLAMHDKSNRLPPLLWQHNTEVPIGAWREMREDSHGLYVKGELFVHDIAQSREAYKLLKENVVTGLSIGYRTRQSHREKKSGVRVLTKLDLLEVSLVTFPANEMARVTGVKSTDVHFKQRLDDAIRDIKNDIAARRLRESLHKAAAEAYNHKEKQE